MNPYLPLLAFVVAVGAFCGGEINGKERGETSERLAWQTRANTELAAANAKILELENAARASEQTHGETQHLISQSYERDLQNAQTNAQRDLDAARSGALRLRDPGAAAVATCGSTAAPAPTTASGRDAGADAGFSSEATAFLLSESTRADAVVRQLAACQAVVLSDRMP